MTLGKKLGIPGIALAIQTFGDYAKWHPHVHALVMFFLLGFSRTNLETQLPPSPGKKFAAPRGIMLGCK